jgi:hypothetical protein
MRFNLGRQFRVGQVAKSDAQESGGRTFQEVGVSKVTVLCDQEHAIGVDEGRNRCVSRR